MIAFVAIVLLIFTGGGSLVSYLTAPSPSPLTTCNCPLPTSTLSYCPSNYPNGADIGQTLFLGDSSPSNGFLCVKFYYYNSTAPDTIDTMKQIAIYSPTSSGTLDKANSLFSITADVSQFQIGGSGSENEGIQVAYRIFSNVSTPSRTYEIGFSSGLYPKNVICGYGIYIYLQVGNTTNSTVGSSCHYVPSPSSNPGLVYTEFVGITNSS